MTEVVATQAEASLVALHPQELLFPAILVLPDRPEESVAEVAAMSVRRTEWKMYSAIDLPEPCRLP